MGIGSVLPMGTTAIGHAYLWGLPTVERERLVGALKTQAGAQGSALESRIGDSFTEMEAGGPCGVLGGHRPGTFGIAVPVVVGRDRVVMGLSCGRADVRPDMGEERRRIGPALIESARAIEKALADIAA
jgi:DNA-binding IclR family transcriptional regulator